MQYLVANYNNKTTYTAGGITTTCSLTFGKGYYKLTSDIVLNENYENYKQWEDSPPANNWSPISIFYGNFQGDNHTIYGMYINSNNEHQGLFGLISGATINELNIRFCLITGRNWHTGAVVGMGISNDANYVLNCSVSNCLIKGTFGLGGVYGGISTYSNNYIVNCSTSVDIYATGMYLTSSHMGGIAGLGATIINCVSHCNLFGYGGNIGRIGAFEVDCYNC